MKTKIILTALFLIGLNAINAQETKTATVVDSLKTTIVPANTEIKASDATIPSEAESKRLKKAEKAKKQAEREQEKAQKQTERAQKDKERAEKDVVDNQKDLEKNQKKLEKQQDKIEKEQKRAAKEQEKIADAQKDLQKDREKLSDAQKDLIKDTEKHNKQVAKGKLSPNDIEDYQKDKAKAEKRIEKLKERVEKGSR